MHNSCSTFIRCSTRLNNRVEQNCCRNNSLTKDLWLTSTQICNPQKETLYKKIYTTTNAQTDSLSRTQNSESPIAVWIGACNYVLYFASVKGNAQLLPKRAITWSVIKMAFTLCIVSWVNTIKLPLLKLYNCTDMISLPADLIGSSFYLTHLTWGCLDTGEQANIWMHWSECQWMNAS